MATDIRLKGLLPEITELLVGTYTECPTITHLDHKPLPSRDVIGHILADLIDVLYPGYARRQNLHIRNIEYYVGDLIDSLHDKLVQQIARAHCYDYFSSRRPEDHYAAASDLSRGGVDLDTADFESKAQEVTLKFLQGLPQLRRVLKEDVRAAYEGDPAARGPHEIVFCYPGLEAITTYRLAHELVVLGVPLIPRLMTEIAHSKTGIDIHPGANIGTGFFIDHGTGVVIGETCDIGEHVKLYQGVTLGALSFPRDANDNIIRGRKRHPTLEHDVVVYANATILGGDTVVGHHSVIGSSVMLTFSVDPHSKVTLDKPSLRIRSPGTVDPGWTYQI